MLKITAKANVFSAILETLSWSSRLALGLFSILLSFQGYFYGFFFCLILLFIFFFPSALFISRNIFCTDKGFPQSQNATALNDVNDLGAVKNVQREMQMIAVNCVSLALYWSAAEEIPRWMLQVSDLE